MATVDSIWGDEAGRMIKISQSAGGVQLTIIELPKNETIAEITLTDWRARNLIAAVNAALAEDHAKGE